MPIGWNKVDWSKCTFHGPETYVTWMFSNSSVFEIINDMFKNAARTHSVHSECYFLPPSRDKSFWWMLSAHRTRLRIPRPHHTLLGYTLLLILHSQAQRWWQVLMRALKIVYQTLLGIFSVFTGTWTDRSIKTQTDLLHVWVVTTQACSQVHVCIFFFPTSLLTHPVWQLWHAVRKVFVSSGAKTYLLYKGGFINSSCCNLAPDHIGQSGQEKRKERGQHRKHWQQ